MQDLPDFGAVRGLAEALWEIGDLRGAAVMVGAGFSRNAELATPLTPRPPLWSDLSSEMARQLYPHQDRYFEPLRLAEEYRAAMGQPALDALIRSLVPDNQWLPGDAHRKLVKLPWADILTTNWDTLLERSAAEIPERRYEPVHTIAEIARTRSPRIVKLHGSLPSHTPFVVAEEDYRTYPRGFAPFVNLAQQVLLENELCLLGFSGDDPNFLQWTGWVRDELGSSSRRIHLVGVLDLSSASRRFLQARNVTPIDLAPLVKDIEPTQKHAVATCMFLDYLAQAKPEPLHLWPTARKANQRRNRPSNGADAKAAYLKSVTADWQAEREQYPGWLVCQLPARERLRYDTDEAMPALEVGMQGLSVEERSRLLFELAWRFDVTFWPLPTHVAHHLATLLAGNAAGLSGSEKAYLAAILIRTAREQQDEAKFKQWSDWLAQHAANDQEATSRGKYEACLWARDNLDFPAVEAALKDLRGSDPAWLLRRAALFAELGQDAAAEGQIVEALRKLRSLEARDRKSIWVHSRQAWALMLARACRMSASKQLKQAVDLADVLSAEDWPTRFAAVRCDPWDELHFLDMEYDRAVSQKRKDAIEIEARFDAGTYADHSGGIRLVSHAAVSPDYQARRTFDEVGFPPRLAHTSLAGDRLVRGLDLLDEPRKAGTLYRVLDQKTIDKYFSRLAVAQLPSSFVEDLTTKLVAAIDYGVQRFIEVAEEGSDRRFNTYWVDRTRDHVELLSRLAVRLSAAEAERLFLKACSYASDGRWAHWWLYEHLSNLLRRTLEAMPPALRARQALRVISIPLASERDATGPGDHWPEITDSLPRKGIERSETDGAWTHRIRQITRFVADVNGHIRAPAIHRLLHFYEAGILTGQETHAFRDALWSRLFPSGLPADTRLHSDVLLRLPAPDGTNTETLFRATYHANTGKGPSGSRLLTIARAAHKWPDGPSPVLPTVESALLLLDHCLAWRPSQEPIDDFMGLKKRQEEELREAIGRALSSAILPPLRASDVSVEKLQDLFRWIEADHASSAIQALPQLCRLHPPLLPDATKLLRRRLLSRSGKHVEAGIRAVRSWIELPSSEAGPCPRETCQTVVSSVANRRFPRLAFVVSAARSLVDANLLQEGDLLPLVDGLEALRDEAAYDVWDPQHRETHMLSFLRASCLRLAGTLVAHGQTAPILSEWIRLAAEDPAPEVRFANLQDETS